MNSVLMQLSDSVLNTHHNAGWRLTPADRDALVHMHQAGEQLVRENASRDVYFRAIEGYLHYLVYIRVFPAVDRGILLRALAVTDNQATTKAVLYRINCQTLRFLSELCECTQPCCCNCHANYPDIACTSLEKMTLGLHKFDESDESDEYGCEGCENCAGCSTDPGDTEGDGSGMGN